MEEEDDPSRAASLVLEVFERWAEEARQRDRSLVKAVPFQIRPRQAGNNFGSHYLEGNSIMLGRVSETSSPC